ncbi:MAG: acyltransferase [Bdellovibrio sp.]
MNKAKTAARLIYGLLWVVFGLNFFLHFLPQPAEVMPEAAMKFLGGLMAAPYFMPMVKVTEIVVGIMLLANIAVPLALILISPIVVNILLFHTVLAPASPGIALAVTALNVFLGIAYWNSFKPLFKKV